MDLKATIMIFADLQQWLFPALIAVLTATLLLRIYNVRRRSESSERRTSGREAKPGRTGSWTPQADAVAVKTDIPDAVARWELHLEERGRTIAAEVDSKLRLLQVYVSEADRASARLEAVLCQLEDVLQTQAPELQEVLEPAGRFPARETLGVQGSGNQSEELENPQIQTQIGVLWDYGFGVGDIASRMGLTGEQVKAVLESRNTNS